MGRRLALLIAGYDYQDPGLRRLTAPAQDAEAFAAVLEDSRIAGFDVTTLINESLYRVGETIGEFYRNTRRDDLTLLYFTGHGLKDDRGRLYLAMTNTRRDNLMFTALSADHINEAMDGCVSRHKILVLDCCYSGAFPEGRATKGDSDVHALERFTGSGRTVLTASDSTQFSFEGDEISGGARQSVFTRYLVEGLRDGTADLDGDGDITLDELYSYVHDRVVEEMPEQRPKKQDNVEGRTVIARNVHWSLPRHLRNNLDSPIAQDKLLALQELGRLSNVGNQIVRATVRVEIERLVEDDSRRVAAAAVAALAGLNLRAERQQATRPTPVVPVPEAAPAPAAAPPEPSPKPVVQPPTVAELLAEAHGAERAGDLDQAESLYRAAADRGSASGMYRLAAVLERRGELADAEKWYRDAAAAATDDPEPGENAPGKSESGGGWWSSGAG